MTRLVLLVLGIAGGEPATDPEPVPTPKPSSPLVIDASVGGGVTQQPLGQLEPLAQLTLGVRRGWARLQLSPMYVFGRPFEVEGGAGNPSSRAIGGRLDTLASFAVAPFLRLEGGVTLTVLATLGGGRSPLLVAPGVLACVPFNLGGFRFGLEGGTGLNLFVDSFFSEGSPRFFGTVGAFVGHTIP